jgi:hypothetical protein
MLSVTIKSGYESIIPNIVMLSVIMLNVVAPWFILHSTFFIKLHSKRSSTFGLKAEVVAGFPYFSDHLPGLGDRVCQGQPDNVAALNTGIEETILDRKGFDAL